MDSDDEFMDPDDFVDIDTDLIPDFESLKPLSQFKDTPNKVKVPSKKETIEFICKNYVNDKIRAELLLDFLYMSVVSAVMGKMGFKSKKISRKKKLLNSNIRNFLYNCIRTNMGESSKDLYEEEFVIRELAPEDYATQREAQREAQEDLSRCSECGSTNVDIDPVMQTITCCNCGYTKQTRANGITFSHLASYVDNSNYVKTASGKKIYVKSIDEVITTLYEKINELFGSDGDKLTAIMGRIQGLGYRDIPTKELYGRIVKLIISMYPRDYYNNPESLSNLLKKIGFGLIDNFHDYNKFVISENFRNLFYDYRGSIKNTHGIQLSLDMDITTFATLLWMNNKGINKREEIAKIFGLNPFQLTEKKNELELKTSTTKIWK